MQLVVGQQAAQLAARGLQGAVEGVIGVVQVVGTVGGDEAAAVEGGVVRHEWQVAHQWLESLPHFVECGRVLGVLARQSVYGGVIGEVVVGVGLYEAVSLIYYLPVPDEYKADAAHARPHIVGGLKVYCYEIVHVMKLEVMLSLLIWIWPLPRCQRRR